VPMTAWMRRSAPSVPVPGPASPLVLVTVARVLDAQFV
jgi:hypothetical protein